MPSIAEVSSFLESFAPSRLAEEWDNVGLLVGDEQRAVHRLMTCLTITPPVVAEAIERRAELIVTHHPLPFRPLKRLTGNHTVGRILLSLIEHKVAVYSPHTAFDSTLEGINDQLAQGIGLEDILPLAPIAAGPAATGMAEGAGRVGRFPTAKRLDEVVSQVKQFLGIDRLQVVGNPETSIQRAAVGCGSAGQFLEPAYKAGCQLLVTGETNFHTCLEAEALSVGLILPGHYASERFAVESLAKRLALAFPQLDIWPSAAERDPLTWR